MLSNIKNDLRSLGSKKKAEASAWFFKTGPGEYGEGDVFIGLTVPEQRRIAKKYRDLSLTDAVKLLRSKEHEFRLTALIIMVEKFRRGSEKEKKMIFDRYLKNTKWINNWDLVDSSAPYIVGGYLLGRPHDLLFKMARSSDLWQKRIAIISTFAFIMSGQPGTTLQIAEILINDEHDLIHKATGWMLREVGKRCGESEEEVFLKKYHKTMPRTMLRYAIERFPEQKRKGYLQK